jgi:hypothetical protein
VNSDLICVSVFVFADRAHLWFIVLFLENVAEDVSPQLPHAHAFVVLCGDRHLVRLCRRPEILSFPISHRLNFGQEASTHNVLSLLVHGLARC